MRLLLGGSPCTCWSIAQTRNRETRPEGTGWELFRNYLIAKKRYAPDFYLYENNRSIAVAIQRQITAELGAEPILINSALVSAQNRQRLYWTNIPGVQQPEDLGIILRDILESGLPLNITNDGKAGCLRATYYKDGIRNLVGNLVDRKSCVAIPVRVGTIESNTGSEGQGYRVYLEESKVLYGNGRGRFMDDRFNCPMTSCDCYQYCVAMNRTIYQVHNGQILIGEKSYPVKLIDGRYIIRKLTIRECMRLQTVPEDYMFPVSDTQAYKMLGNGWTVDVTAHILSFCPGITSEPVEVLSMYDGMSCGHLALDKLNANTRRYYATEIDKYAIKTTQENFPDTIQLGDAFGVREDEWWSFLVPKEEQ